MGRRKTELAADVVEGILAAYAAGEPVKQITKKFHVGAARLYQLLKDREAQQRNPLLIGKTGKRR